MSAVLKPIHRESRQRSPHSGSPAADQQRPLAPAGQRRSRASARSSEQSQATVQRLPARVVPTWLRGLVLAQQGSAILMLTMLVSVLAVYGWTVYVQQNWGRLYQRLAMLQQQQRQMTAVMEMLKYQTAQAIDASATDYQVPHPEQLIFMSPAEPRSAEPAPSAPAPPSSNPQMPLGY